MAASSRPAAGSGKGAAAACTRATSSPPRCWQNLRPWPAAHRLAPSGLPSLITDMSALLSSVDCHRSATSASWRRQSTPPCPRTTTTSSSIRHRHVMCQRTRQLPAADQAPWRLAPQPRPRAGGAATVLGAADRVPLGRAWGGSGGCAEAGAIHRHARTSSRGVGRCQPGKSGARQQFVGATVARPAGGRAAPAEGCARGWGGRAGLSCAGCPGASACARGRRPGACWPRHV